jgi:hypothetical protein
MGFRLVGANCAPKAHAPLAQKLVTRQSDPDRHDRDRDLVPLHINKIRGKDVTHISIIPNDQYLFECYYFSDAI